MKFDIKKALFIILAIGVILISLSIFGCDNPPTPPMIPKYEVQFTTNKVDIGVIDSIVYINQQPLSKEHSRAVIELIAYSVDNNKLYVAVDTTGATSVLPPGEIKRSGLHAIRMVLDSTQIGQPDPKVKYELIPPDSIFLYNSYYEQAYKGFVLVSRKKGIF